MLAVLVLGDSGLLILRSVAVELKQFEVVFDLQATRAESFNAANSKSLARQSEEVLASDIIENESFVQCVSVQEGDFVVLGNSVVFESLTKKGITDICNEAMLAPQYSSASPSALSELAEEVVLATYAKAMPEWLSRRTVGDASVVVAEVVDWQLARRGNLVRKSCQPSPVTLYCNKIGTSGQPRAM